MFNYLAFLWGGLPSASDKAFVDGEALAKQVHRRVEGDR